MRRTSHILLALFLLACAGDDDSILPVVRDHLKRYPDMQPADLYKLVHQAAMGSGHLMDGSDARMHLLQEFATIGPDTVEPITERLSPDGRVIRVNLRTYIARGGVPDSLAAAMERSAAAFRPRSDMLERWWDELSEEAAYGTIPADVGTLREYFRQRLSEGFPAVDHSEEYETAYAPSYRVILREHFPVIVPLALRPAK